MVTRLKPQRVKSSNSPQVGQNLGYEDSNNFKWQDTGSGVGDMKYSDFEWETLTGNAITIEDISNNITPSSNFTVSAGTVKPGIEYVLRVNTGNTAYTMTLGTGVTNPNGYSTELTPNKVNQFKFIATSTSQLELEGVDTSEYLTGLTILSYGTSTWNDFITAYQKNSIVYCRASSNSNPATGAQNRLAFMAYVNDASSPTEVEFQYYRSRSSHSTAQTQQDEVYVYKLTNTSGGTWTVTARDTATRITTGTGLTNSYATSSGITTMTIANDGVLTVNGNTGTVIVNDIKQSATAPANPTAGTAWYDTTNGALKVYNGSAWDTIATGGAISDTAYGPGWDGQTTTAPSQNAVYDKISSIDALIPSEATSSNQLADKAFVGDSINSVTAYYITKNANGDQFATYAELAAATTFYSGGVVRVPTKNDYTIVLSDENHDNATTRYIYNNGWEYQYTVNETALTQAQLNALNSGITSAKVSTYDGYASTIAGKQDTLVSGTNIKTVNNQSLLGSGNITIQGGGVTSVNGQTGAVTVNDVKVGNTAPSNPTDGIVWYDTDLYNLQVYNGSTHQWDTLNNIFHMVTPGVGDDMADYINILEDSGSRLLIFSFNENMSDLWIVTDYGRENWDEETQKYENFKITAIGNVSDNADTTFIQDWGLTRPKGIATLEIIGTHQLDTYVCSTIQFKESGGLKVAPNSPITGIKYVWYGTEADYANLSQYYTDTPGDTEFHCF